MTVEHVARVWLLFSSSNSSSLLPMYTKFSAGDKPRFPHADVARKIGYDTINANSFSSEPVSSPKKDPVETRTQTSGHARVHSQTYMHSHKLRASNCRVDTQTFWKTHTRIHIRIYIYTHNHISSGNVIAGYLASIYILSYELVQRSGSHSVLIGIGGVRLRN